MATFSNKRLVFTPPDKGSFPIDHEGVCKDLMMKYMDCLGRNKRENTKCREEIKSYLDCRMNNNLMAKESWRKLERIKMSAASSISNGIGSTSQKNILIGCTGSVASLKIPEIVNKLLKHGNFCVKVVATERAKHFFKREDIPETELLSDIDEWTAWNCRGDPVVHIELVKWADLFVIAPLDANTLGKLSSGLCDNLLTCVARAWNIGKPLLFCPAMNTKMYEHPITRTQIATLKSWGYVEIPVVSKVLVCGDKGAGAMAEVDTIVNAVIDKTTQR
ncbi:hypothetical protein RUM44_008503 [Polyplax serrata]|uniref:Flavoprotein domain-containing protein n=1 Tax=Polyplax serrata TaxID=468196 RepID=A0ABR1B8F4_POLSC